MVDMKKLLRLLRFLSFLLSDDQVCPLQKCDGSMSIHTLNLLYFLGCGLKLETKTV